MFAHALLTLLALARATDQGTPEHQGSGPIEGFRYAPERLVEGRLYRYEKSNVDGTRASRVDLYVASATRIESFKYDAGHPGGTLVIADMDWRTFSVRRFETYDVREGGTRTKVAELETQEKILVGKVGNAEFRVPIERFPWHTYDFDLASLNVCMRFLTDPEGVVLVHMIDRVGGRLTNKGFVEVRFASDEERAGIACRRYTIDGPGLDDRGGELWVRSDEDPVIVDYEIDLPDEPGMRSGKLRLLGTGRLTREEWERHQAGTRR